MTHGAGPRSSAVVRAAIAPAVLARRPPTRPWPSRSWRPWRPLPPLPSPPRRSLPLLSPLPLSLRPLTSHRPRASHPWHEAQPAHEVREELDVVFLDKLLPRVAALLPRQRHQMLDHEALRLASDEVDRTRPHRQHYPLGGRERVRKGERLR